MDKTGIIMDAIIDWARNDSDYGGEFEIVTDEAYSLAEKIINALPESEPVPGDGWLCEKCTCELFNGETDKEIAKRKWAEFLEDRNPKKVSHYSEFPDWVESEECT